MDWKDQLRNKALGLLGDPRLAALLHDPRVTRGLISAFKLRSRLEQQLGHSARQLAKTLNLATATELHELRRAVSRLERQLEQERHEQAELSADSRTLS